MRRTLLVLGLVVGLSACAEDEPEPPAQAEHLADEVDALQRQLRESLDKHLSLLNTRLNDYESRITALPAQQEAQLRRPYSELIVQTGEVKQLFKQWIEASGERGDELRPQLEEARQRLDEAFERFEARLVEAEEK